MRFEAERGREGLQRQLAALDGHAHVLAQRLEDAELENHALEHRVRVLPTFPVLPQCKQPETVCSEAEPSQTASMPGYAKPMTQSLA